MTSVKKIVAVTSCATGVAHTYMAAKGLENEAKKRGLEIKVQKNAQAGTEDLLSAADIRAADAVIIAADIKVDLAPFDGKALLSVSVKEGFSNPAKLFDKVLKGVPIYHHKDNNQTLNTNQETAKTFKAESKMLVKRSYSQLLTGVSYMLPFVVAGGILIAISFFWGIWSADLEKHPDDYVSFAASLKAIGDAAFTLMVPILAGFLAYAIGDRPALVPGMVGGYLANVGFENRSSGFLGAIVAGYLAGWMIVLLRRGTFWIPKSMNSIRPIIIYPLISSIVVGLLMIWGVNYLFDPLFNPKTGLFTEWLSNMESASKVALAIVMGILISVDFGGPVNKVAYLFGVAALTTSLDNGEKSTVMAAVSAGCMTPPLTTFVATSIFRKKFSMAEINAGATNLLLGAFHITEGAIPFAAKKPWINLPVFMLGSTIATTMSILLGAATSAPHGGIAVVALVDKWYWWILAIIVGAIISGLLLGLVTKKSEREEENVIFASLG